MVARLRSERQARMRAVVDDHIRFVTRTLTRAGVPRWELDDEVQQTFIVAAKRLEDVNRGDNLSKALLTAARLMGSTKTEIGLDVGRVTAPLSGFGV